MTQRPELQRFADRMESILKDNDHKGGWDNEENDYLFNYLMAEAEELRQAIEIGDEDKVRKECCDLANLAMMLFNNNEDL